MVSTYLKKSIKLLLLASGIVSLTRCNTPTVKNPIDSCVTSQKFQVARCGKRILDYKQAREKVAEWKDVNSLTDTPIDEMPDMVCFGISDWLLKIKPKLKEGHDAWSDSGAK